MLTKLDISQNGVAWLTLRRPEARNALSLELLDELFHQLEGLAARLELRALVLSGDGPGFCAGADLKERLGQTPEQRTAHTAAVRRLTDGVASMPVPSIAVVHGFAVAGGAELALACDLRASAPNALWGFPEVSLGIFPGGGAPERLPGLVGQGKARELLFTGRKVTGDEALSIGLVQRVADDPFALAGELADEIASGAPLAIRALKLALDKGDVQSHRQPLDATRDYQEGLTAFVERRPPRFEGR